MSEENKKERSQVQAGRLTNEEVKESKSKKEEKPPSTSPPEKLSGYRQDSSD